MDWATELDRAGGDFDNRARADFPRALRVLIADNDRLVAEALMFTLDSDPRVEAIGYALNGWEALDLVASLEPDAVVIGPTLAGLDPLELTRWLHELCPGLLPIVLRERLVPREIEELYGAGAADCITTGCSADELLHAISASRRRQIVSDRARRASALRVLRPGDVRG